MAASPRSLLRTAQWWSPKVLPLLGVTLLGFVLAGSSPSEGLPLLLAMVVSAVGIAGASHVLNDWADVDADRLAGKPSAVAALAPAVRAAILAAGVLVGVVPWLLVDPGPVVWAAVGGLLVVPVVYSCPPVRLKGRGLGGVLADATDAHVLPTVVALGVAARAGSTDGPGWWTGAAGATIWALGFGLRSILAHQRSDVGNDRAASVGTYVVRHGHLAAVRRGRWALAVELLGVVLVAAALLVAAPLADAAFAGYLLLWLAHRRWDRRPIEPVPAHRTDWMVLAEFYEVWPALTFGAVLVARDLAWWPAPVAIVVAFWPTVAKQAADLGELLVASGQDLVALVRRLGAAIASAWWWFHGGPLATFRFGVVPGVRWAVHDAWADIGHFQRRQRRRWRRLRSSR